MAKDKEKKEEQYASDDPTTITQEDLEKMAKEAVKKFKSLS